MLGDISSIEINSGRVPSLYADIFTQLYPDRDNGYRPRSSFVLFSAEVDPFLQIPIENLDHLLETMMTDLYDGFQGYLMKLKETSKPGDKVSYVSEHQAGRSVTISKGFNPLPLRVMPNDGDLIRDVKREIKTKKEVIPDIIRFTHINFFPIVCDPHSYLSKHYERPNVIGACYYLKISTH